MRSMSRSASERTTASNRLSTVAQDTIRKEIEWPQSQAR